MIKLILAVVLFLQTQSQICKNVEQAGRYLTMNDQGASYIEQIISRPSFKLPRVSGKFWMISRIERSGTITRAEMVLREVSINSLTEIQSFEREYKDNEELAVLGVTKKILFCFTNAAQGLGYFVYPNMEVSFNFWECKNMQQCSYEYFIMLTPVRRLEVYGKIAEKLAILHESGRVHGNIRPEKIMFDKATFKEPFLEYFSDEFTLPTFSVIARPTEVDAYITDNKIIEYYDLEALECLRRWLKKSGSIGECQPFSEASDIYALLITIHKIEMFINWRSPDLVFTELNFRRVPQSEFFETVRSEALSFNNYWRSGILLCIRSQNSVECVHRLFAQMAVAQRKNRLISARRIADTLNKFRENKSEYLQPNFEMLESFSNAYNDKLEIALYDDLLDMAYEKQRK